MSTTAAITPPSAAPSFNDISYENHPTLNQLSNLQIEDDSTNTSHTSSPESRPIDLRSPIPEEEEEEDETSSEAANEPVTPTDNHHPYTFQDRMNGAIKP